MLLCDVCTVCVQRACSVRAAAAAVALCTHHLCALVGVGGLRGQASAAVQLVVHVQGERAALLGAENEEGRGRVCVCMYVRVDVCI